MPTSLKVRDVLRLLREDGNFAGMSPDVLGCISTGNTLESMRAMMREALEFHLEGIAKDGDPIPEPHTTSIDFTEGDFAGVEYFFVEHLEVSLPRLEAQQPSASAA